MKWVMCCWQLITMIVSSRDQVAGSADSDFSVFWLRDSLALQRSFSLRVMRSYRPQLFREAFAASSARIRRASEIVRILSPWTGRIGGMVAVAMWRTFSRTGFHCGYSMLLVTVSSTADGD